MTSSTVTLAPSLGAGNASHHLPQHRPNVLDRDALAIPGRRQRRDRLGYLGGDHGHDVLDRDAGAVPRRRQRVHHLPQHRPNVLDRDALAIPGRRQRRDRLGYLGGDHGHDVLDRDAGAVPRRRQRVHHLPQHRPNVLDRDALAIPGRRQRRDRPRHLRGDRGHHVLDGDAGARLAVPERSEPPLGLTFDPQDAKLALGLARTALGSPRAISASAASTRSFTSLSMRAATAPSSSARTSMACRACDDRKRLRIRSFAFAASSGSFPGSSSFAGAGSAGFSGAACAAFPAWLSGRPESGPIFRRRPSGQEDRSSCAPRSSS